MESPTPGSRYIAQSSKKRVFPGGSSSSGFEEVEILETAPTSKINSKPTSSKNKEPSRRRLGARLAPSDFYNLGQEELNVVCEIIDLDKEEDRDDVILIKGETDRKGKGKEISSNISSFVDKLSSVDGSLNFDLDDPSSHLFFGEDEWIDTYYDDITFDDYSIMESQFDHMDLPSGVEVPFPWLPDVSTPPNGTNNNNTPTSSVLKIEEPNVGDLFPDNFVPDSTPSHYPLKKLKFKEHSVSSSLKKDSMLETGRGWMKYLNSSNNTNYPKPENEPLLSSVKYKRKNFATNVYTSPNHNFQTGLTGSSLLNKGSGVFPMWKDLPFNLAETYGMMSGSGFGFGPRDFSGDLNVEPPPGPVVEQNLDEIIRNFDGFKKFDTVEDCSDHYYATTNSLNQAIPPKNWAKRIQEEWKILEKDLPDTIFVRVYESRMDLLRAVIVGAEGTPYHDGLFFFDVCFPASYPNSPPQVFYHSGGLRLNPNLYNGGKVCLSLLNTWPGQSQKEQWIPGVSTMLQVLVSIQGLILNAEPYFNEPGCAGFNGTERGQKSSLLYNENTFILSLQTMVYSMNRPPKHFEALVAGHFCKHARDILVSCKAYLEGAQVGCLVRGGVQDVDEGDKSCSENFKYRLAGFITKLIDTFARIGAKDCDEFRPLAEKANGPAIGASPFPRPGKSYYLKG
ncbi:putative ubiquitin-conjugating enzyme e2 38 [Phtheirospermum japonicum]|uniref:E2 ubiquitin-conjugating enzyme n=1 Tax=Phtheirospermum japonicum TaxID=374723 RepID=A0A830AZK4_9LAMI|nr:putative ubiquitin-conjugating enzyme e2 38 [Phtheirospermum japonicum]